MNTKYSPKLQVFVDHCKKSVGRIPPPWRVGPNGHSIYANDADLVCTSNSFGGRIEMEDNAAFIVRACNSHDDLVAALAGMMPENTGYGQSMDWEAYAAAVKVARAALAKAKG